MSRSRIVVVKVLSSFLLGAAVTVLLGGCTSNADHPSNYALTGTNGSTGFTPPAYTVDSKGHYHPDWSFHGAPGK